MKITEIWSSLEFPHVYNDGYNHPKQYTLWDFGYNINTNAILCELVFKLRLKYFLVGVYNESIIL